MKKNRRNNSRPAAITTAKDTTKAIETRAGVLKEAEDVKKEAKTSFYLQYMGKRNQHRGDYTESTRSMENFGEKCR